MSQSPARKVFRKDVAALGVKSEVFRVYASGEVEVGLRWVCSVWSDDLGPRDTDPSTASPGDRQFSLRRLFGLNLSQSSAVSSISSSLSTKSSSSSDSVSSMESILNLKRCFGTV